MGKEKIMEYGINETAKLTGIKPRTVREWVRNGKIKAHKPDGSRRWVITEAEIARIRAQRAKAN